MRISRPLFGPRAAAAAILVALGLVTWGMWHLVVRTTRDWFDRDLALRAELALSSGRRALAAHWRRGELRQLEELLGDVARDERIMAAAACSPAQVTIARTPEYPTALDCERLRHRLSAGPWRGTISLASGDVHVSALPLAADAEPLGVVLLVHDLSFVQRRESQTRSFLLLAFALLALTASAITALVVRLSWRGWSRGLLDALRGGDQRPEFRPLLADVRDLVDRIASERESEADAGLWGPERLRSALDRYLRRERVVIVANREPYIHERQDDGSVRVLHPASGLVTALEPVMRACSGVWVAHGSGSADRQTADDRGRVRVPPGDPSYVLRRVWLGADEERGYYYGFANEGLWPLCHLAHTRPAFRREDWLHYREVNRRFAEAVCDEVDSEDAVVLVQDYHFALVPGFIRERLPRATIITFWHIPWPNAERFGICPFREELLEGLLGSSIVGFHTQLHCNNFVESVDRFLEARIDREDHSVVHDGRRSQVRPYPISIEWPNRWAEQAPPVAECRASVLAELGLPPDALIGVGVDRMDYTKGIEERLVAVERLLERQPALRGRFTFAQLAAPSRTTIERYQQLNERVESLANRINERFGQGQYRPIALLRAHHEPPAVFRYLRAADVCYVSSLHDGMNLVAKEFVAARDDEQGVLVLSQFTGAARELTEALVVNPYDTDQAADALAAALEMTSAEQRERMRTMRQYLREYNVYRWAGRMIIDAARLRRRERLVGRLTNPGQRRRDGRDDEAPPLTGADGPPAGGAPLARAARVRLRRHARPHLRPA